VKKGNGSKQKSSTNGSDLNFEAQLSAAAYKLRGHMDASNYKHVCLGFLVCHFPAPSL
jgi:type I restriction enzyme M protein